MTNRFAPYILSAAAILSMSVLTACNNKGGTAAVPRPINAPPNGAPIPGRPGQPAQQVPVPNGQVQNQGPANIPAQTPDTKKVTEEEDTSDPTQSVCFNGDEAQCQAEKAKKPSNAGSGNVPPKLASPPAKQNNYEEEDDTMPTLPNGKATVEGADIPMRTEKPVALKMEYTGAARDGYRTHLTALMNERMRNSEIKTEYYETVAAITRVKATLQGKNLQVVVAHKEGESEKIIMLAGSMNGRSGVAHLKKQNGMAERTGQRESLFSGTSMSGVAVCADEANNTCQVMLIRLLVGAEEVPVWVIYRSTNADLAIHPWQGAPGYANANNLFQYFVNTGRQNTQSVNVVLVDSFEVINGASGMKITTLMHDNQVLSARGPLLAPKESKLTNVKWNMDVEISDLYDENARSGFRTNLQQTLSAVHLIGNDGRMNFTLMYSLPPFGNEKSTTFDITYVRLQPLVKNIEVIRGLLLGAKVKTEL